MTLTQKKIQAIKPAVKPYKITDENGLYLFVTPANAKYWRFKYRFDGKERTLAFGVYPEISLAKAREKRDEIRKLLANNVDPHVAKQAKAATRTGLSNSFEAIAREWFIKFRQTWVESNAEKVIRRLEMYVFPWIGQRPMIDITPPELLAVLRRIESKGALDTTHRIRQYCGQIFRYAIATGRAERDPSQDLRGAIPAVKATHHASIVNPKEIGILLRAIEQYSGAFIIKCALKLAALLFVRPGELRYAEWNEIDFEVSEWRIPAIKMKMRAVHIVPLSIQAISILQELQPLTGKAKYLFPGIRVASQPISDNTVNAALRGLGYTNKQMTGHGFRSMASTLLNEQGWNRDAIERQLAHGERNGVRAAYNYAEYLPERRKMMQHWADFLEQLKNNVAPLTNPQ